MSMLSFWKKNIAILKYVAPPHGALGWSAVCECGISWSYSLTFRNKSLKLFPAYLIDLFFIQLQDMLIVRR